MTNRVQRLLVALGLVALLVPATAIARPDHAGKGKGQNTAASKSKGKSAKGQSKGKKKGHAKRAYTYVFKGTVAAGDRLTVNVTGGNSRVKKADPALVGTAVLFDLTGTKFVGEDINGDGTRNADDLVDGNPVVVQVKRLRTDTSGTWKARKVVLKAPEQS